MVISCKFLIQLHNLDIGLIFTVKTDTVPSKDEKFLEEVRWAEVRIKRVKVTRIHCGPSVAPLLFSQPYKYIQRMLDEAARWSGGCDEAESNGGIGGSGACTHLSTQSSVVFFFKHLEKKGS